MEAFASIVLLVIAMFVCAGFAAVTEKLDEIIVCRAMQLCFHACTCNRAAIIAQQLERIIHESLLRAAGLEGEPAQVA